MLSSTFSCCVTPVSLRSVASPSNLSSHFESTICPVLDVVNSDHFSSTSSVFHDITSLINATRLYLRVSRTW